MADLYDLFGEDPAVAQAQARALADAMNRRRAMGNISTIIGGPFAGQGKAFLGEAGQAGDTLVHAGQFQTTNARAKQKMLVDAAQWKAEQDRMAGAAAESARHNKAAEAQAAAAMEQDAWTYGQDATGGGFLFSKKTGEMRTLGPNGSFPGSGSGLKPQQFEADVQSLGKDMEPIAKVQNDMATLKGAAAKGDVAGFGPVAGRVPNALANPEAVANRQAAARIMAGIIQMTSGQAASEKEVDRLLEANGLGRTATEAQIKEGVAKLDSQYQNLVQQRQAKYHPTVVDTYGKRGGFVGDKGTSAPPKKRRFNPVTGALE